MRVPRTSASRDFEGGNYFDLFFFTAIATILITRLYLHLTGYPQIGGGTLHIAHMLWGGLGMLVAMLMLFLFLGRRIKYPASFIGGIGFGLFIDELGKFITKDNDYFFQPTIALIYLVFVLMYVTVRSIHREQLATPQDFLVNALAEMEEVALDDLEPDERDRIRRYLESAPQNDALTKALHEVLAETSLIPDRRPPWILQIKQRIDELYRRAILHPRFSTMVSLVFLGLHTIKIVSGLIVIFFAKQPDADTPTVYHLGEQPRVIADFDLLDWVHGLSYVASTILAVLGVLLMVRRRLAAYRMFQRSVLVSILVTQPFMFYRDQWAALIGLVAQILLYVMIGYLIDEEKRTVADD